jgi:hypothetical protein
MQLPQPHQMARDTAAICDLCDLFQGFSKPRQLVRVAKCVSATLIPLNVCRPSGDCTYGKLKRRFPNCVPRLDCAELHGQSMLQVRCNKHIDHHLWQILRDEKVALHVDMEFVQIY